MFQSMILVSEEKITDNMSDITQEETILSILDDNPYGNSNRIEYINDYKTQGYAIYDLGDGFVITTITIFDNYYVTFIVTLPESIGHKEIFLTTYQEMATFIEKE